MLLLNIGRQYQHDVEGRMYSGKEKYHDDDKRGVNEWRAVSQFAWHPRPGVGQSTEK